MQLAILDQMKLIPPDALESSSAGERWQNWRTADGTDVGTCGSLRVIAALEFLEHCVFKLGDRNLPVAHATRSLLLPHPLPVRYCRRDRYARVASAAASGSVQTALP